MSDDKKMVLETIKTMHGDFQSTTNEMYRRRKPWTPANPMHLISFIPGTVVSFSVKEGDKVEVGDEVMMYNAMKMNNRVKASVAGVVKRIAVAVGDKLPKGALMIEFE